MPDTNYDPQAKIRPCDSECHKSQFIFEYHLY